MITSSDIIFTGNYYHDDSNDPIESTQLHLFSDESEDFYASATYLRFTKKLGSVHTCLVSSWNRAISLKTKTSKKMSVPRGELNGVVLMSEMFTDIKRALERVYSFEKNCILDRFHRCSCLG